MTRVIGEKLRSISFGAALALAAVVGVAVAQGNQLHGAASSTEQLKQLAALGVPTTGERPRGVDPVVWDALVPDDNKMNEARIALGSKLYFETALSTDGTVSCATCHDVTRSFTDRRPSSEGVGDAVGRRNAPTTMNAALLHAQFWDGRAATLEEQAGQPILNPIEMGLTSKEDAVARLKKAGGYDKLFQSAYGRGINYADIERAIAAFERTLMFLDAPLDRFLAGDQTAISEDAQKGWNLFNGRGRCTACHMMNRANPLGSDNRFHNVGVSARHQDFEKLTKQARSALASDSSERKLDELAVSTDLSELGRFMVTKNVANIGAFRTSQLRNVGITAPYMHDGSMQTLWDTMDHYNKGGEPNPYLDGGMEPLALSEDEIDQIVAFLFTLTDSRFEALNLEEMQRQRKIANKLRPFRDDAMAQRKVLPFEQRALGKPLGGVK